MQWWDRAAQTLVAIDTPLERFGFVTTNSITQEFSRRVISDYLVKDSKGLALVMAIPDHPWLKKRKAEAPKAKSGLSRSKEKGPAAVRIAMTVAQRGNHEGRLSLVKREFALETDKPIVEFHDAVVGRINADLTLGTDSTGMKALRANEGLSARGVGLFGKKFLVSESQARHLGLGKRIGLESVFRHHRNGRDLVQSERALLAIDLFGRSEKEVRIQFPEVYEHLLLHMKPHRAPNRRQSRREKWWLFGEQAPLFREHSNDLGQYIATPVTSKHKIFVFLEKKMLADDALVTIGLDDYAAFGVLSSIQHAWWAAHVGGALGNAPRYTKADCFDPFPFPDPTPQQRTAIADLAEELDATRKLAIAETDKLTMTELYNLRVKLRSGEPMDDKDQRRATKARAAIVDRLHEQLDQAVADAYGWGEEWAAGALGPSEIVARLVALNHERAAEEAQGNIRWLRPDYQIPRFAPKDKK